MAGRRSSGEVARGVLGVLVAVAVLAVVVWREGISPGTLADRFGPAPTPPPGPGTYRFSAHQPGQPDRPVAYDRCRPVRVLLNPDGAPSVEGGVESLVREAVAQVRRATGLRLALDGRTDARPGRSLSFETLGGQDPRVLVAFATPREVPGLAGKVVGLGGSARAGRPGGLQRYVGGQVSLDRDTITEVLRRPTGRAQARAILMHELGHVVGLGHVRDRGELMAAENSGRTTFGPGDLRGLAVLGGQPCG